MTLHIMSDKELARFAPAVATRELRGLTLREVVDLLDRVDDLTDRRCDRGRRC